jgi:hypothetical protein
MRIAFVGASGTGKTTVAKVLAERLGLPFNPVGSRSTAKAMGFEGPYDVDKASDIVYAAYLQDGATAEEAAKAAIQRGGGAGVGTVRARFQRRLQADKIAWETEHESFATDRTTIDDFLYAAIHAPGKLTDVEFISKCIRHYHTYDIVFVTRMAAFFRLGDDPARMNDEGYHRCFEAIAIGLARGWQEEKPALFDLPGMDAVRRVEYALACVSRLDLAT